MELYKLNFNDGAPYELYDDIDRARCRLLQEYFRKDAKPDEVVKEVQSILHFGYCKTGSIGYLEIPKN